MKLLHNATIITAAKEAVGSIVIKDGKIEDILYKEEGDYIQRVMGVMKNGPQIMELEGAQLPRVLDDPKVDVAIISTTYIQQTGLSPVHDSVFIEDKNSPYVNILVAREDNKNAENVKEFLQSYQSPEVAKAAETIFNGGAVPGW